MNNLIIYLIILPILWILSVYVTVPYKTINLKKSGLFVLYGMISVLLVQTFLLIIPNWHILDFTLTGNFEDFTFKKAFFRVAFIEELMKFICFYALFNLYKRGSLFSTMFYCGCVSLGFSLYENYLYTNKFGYDILYIRTFTALPLHVICGMFMGYFISLGRINKQLTDHSLANLFFNKHIRLKKFIFIIIGLMSSIFLHGLYDYNLFYYDAASTYPIMITLLGASLVLVFVAGKNLLKIDKKLK